MAKVPLQKNTEEPLLSILVVNWNTRDMTVECLESVFAETKTISFELIVVDNGSTDGSSKKLSERFPSIHVIEQPVNIGFAAANNLAAKLAQGKYLLLLNSDTLILNGAIERLVEFALAKPEAGIWGGSTIFAGGRPNPTFAWNRITPWSSFCLATGLASLAPDSRWLNPEAVARWGAGEARGVDVVSGCFFLIERKFWEQLSGFDSAFFMYGEEADLCARARDRGARPMITPDARIVHHGGGSQKRRTSTIVYLSGARIGLALRHLPWASGRAVQALSIFGVFWRSALYAVVGWLLPDKREAAVQWQEVWRRRQEWRSGPVSKAV